jgi:hypothetical protein
MVHLLQLSWEKNVYFQSKAFHFRTNINQCAIYSKSLFWYALKHLSRKVRAAHNRHTTVVPLLLPPHSKVTAENLPVAKLVEKFAAIYETQRFIAISTHEPATRSYTEPHEWWSTWHHHVLYEIWSSHGGKHVDVSFVGYNAVWTCMFYHSFGGIYSYPVDGDSNVPPKRYYPPTSPQSVTTQWTNIDNPIHYFHKTHFNVTFSHTPRSPK